MRLISGAILTSLLLTGAGCMRSEPTFEPDIIPPPPKQESINPPGEIKIESAGFKKSFRLNEFASCDIDITYPSFPAGELDEIQQLQIEHEMSHYIALVLGSSAEIDAPSELTSLTARTRLPPNIMTFKAPAKNFLPIFNITSISPLTSRSMKTNS